MAGKTVAVARGHRTNPVPTALKTAAPVPVSFLGDLQPRALLQRATLATDQKTAAHQGHRLRFRE